MQIRYFIDDVEVQEQPSNGEDYTEVRFENTHLALVIMTKATTQQERDSIKAETERAWRDSEIKVCAELKQEADHPYLAEINAYLQLLRDYPSQDSFPNGERPTRPVTPSGSAIIL